MKKILTVALTVAALAAARAQNTNSPDIRPLGVIPPSIVGLSCSPIQTNNDYVLSGASGTHTNSSGTAVDFSQANGRYKWMPNNKGNGFDGSTNTGILLNTNNPNWIGSFQYFGLSFPRWIFYNTNLWLYSGYPANTNAVLVGGLGGSLNGVVRSGNYSTYLPEMTTTNFWTFLPDRAASAAMLTPVYTTNTITIVPFTVSVLGSLLDFPTIGPSHTSVRRANAAAPNQPFPNDPGILRLTTGAGVVRGIEIMTSSSPFYLRSNLWFQVFADYGTNSTSFSSVNSNYMTVNVPLTALSSSKWSDGYGPNGLTEKTWSSEYVDVQILSSSTSIKVSLKTPMLFQNGMFMRVIDVLNNIEVTANFFSTVDYELSATGTLNSQFATWRLHGVNSRYTSGEPSPTGLTDWSQPQTVMFTESNCAGVVLGVWLGLGGLAGGGQAMETANWEWKCDGTGPPAQAEGEDFPFMPWEFSIPAPVLQNSFGMTTKIGNPPDQVDCYRQHGKDFRVSWFNNITAILTSATPSFGDITTLYYASH